MTKRIDWLDTIKGLGIITVVFSHLTNGGEVMRNLLFSFHMPMFLMVSGYLYRPKEKFLPFLKKKAVRLLLPFFICGIVDLVILNVKAYLNGWTISYEAMLKGLFFIDGKAMLNVPVWYLAVLFEIEVLYYFIYKLPLTVKLIICGGAAYVSYFVTETGFLGCGIFVMALVFFIIGDGIKFIMTDTEKTKARRRISFALFIPVCFFWVFLSLRNGFVEIADVKYGNNYGLYYLNAILGTLTFYYLSRKLSGISFLRFFGKHSLSVLCSHYYLSRTIFPLIFKRLGCEWILQTLWGQLACTTVIILFITVLIWDIIYIKNLIKVAKYSSIRG